MAFAQGLGGVGAEVPTGMIAMWGNAVAPADWLLCNGAAVNRVVYADLFAVVGVTFGAGDGLTTFNVPDFRQRFPLGVAAVGTGSTLGGTGGTIDHTHTGPSHTHNPGTLAADAVGGHTHGAGTLSIPAHNHSTPAYTTDNPGGHQHVLNTTTTGPSGTVLKGGTASAVADATHTHNVSASVTMAGGHTHGIAAGLTGDTTIAAPLNGATASDGGHGHTVSGATQAAGTGATGTGNPPFLAVHFIIRT